MVFKFFYKKSQGKGLANNKVNKQLANELRKSIIKKINKKRCILHLKTIFEALIWLICSY